MHVREVSASLVICALLLMGWTFATAQEAETATPILSISTTPRLDPPPVLRDYLDAFERGAEAGVTGNFISYKWSELESTPGEFQLEDLTNGLDYLRAFYDYQFLLGIQLLNITDREIPADLLDVPFDNPRMLERFKALFDALLPYLEEDVRYLSIGNEVDIYLAAQGEWDVYGTFYTVAADYIHQTAPWIQVGVTATYGGVQQHTEELRRLNAPSDVYIITYYPLGAAFTADNLAAPLVDFPLMVELADGLPVILQEVGYPSADLLGGSETEQVEFVQNVFEAWAAAGNAIPFLNYFLMGDLSEQICTELEGYYGLSHPNFHTYLCSIGLRYADGTPKQAWQTFVDEGQAWRASHNQ
jgi:hypothetical protein